ncbi:MAG: XRE family transcriptional regulator [Deltaproteobacteria bacterium]|jgi:antitoxin HicB|nr:XRE family transcriptional regulator [Deltaproteobacteria bacterium]
MKHKNIGSNFDDFLKDEGLLADTEATAIKRVIAFQVDALMKERKISKTSMAKQMNTSRSSLDRLLDPNNTSITLQTLERAAHIIGKRLKIEFV